MKIVITIIVFVLIGCKAYAQTLEVDSSVTSKYRIVKVTKTPESQVIQEPEEDKGFGDMLLSLGDGFIKRLKYRFNLEGVEEKVNKFKKDKPEKDSGG